MRIVEWKEHQQYPLILEVKEYVLIQMKRGLLKRSRALTMNIGERTLQQRTSLKSLPEYDSGSVMEGIDNEEVLPSLPDRLLKAIGLYRTSENKNVTFKKPMLDNCKSDPIFNKNLNEPDIEEKFARLSLAFKTDRFTLEKRWDLQLRQRDIAEKNIDSELNALRESLNALNQLCTESDMRELITKTQQNVDIIQQATKRLSSRAETYGAIQQEQRLNCAFETMLNYMEHLKLMYDKEHLELEEYRRLLAEHNLLPEEIALLEDDPKRVLPPRSQSLSCSSRPESKTRLLSSVCLLNNNFDSTSSALKPVALSGSVSPKSRRSSLPVGPLAQSSSNSTQISNIRAHNSINETIEAKKKRKESFVKTSRENQLSRTESEESTHSRAESESPTSVQEQSEDATDESPLKDSSDVSYPKSSLSSHLDQGSASELHCSLQESTCDNEIDNSIRLLPEIIVPVKSKSVFLLNLIHKAAKSRIWRTDSTTLILYSRYILSAIFAAAAMFTLVLTFVSH